MNAIFSRNFDQETEDEARRIGGVLSEEALSEIRAAAFEEGRAQGAREAEARMREDAETLRAQTLLRISETVGQLLSAREDQERELETQLLDYAIAIGEKVLPDLIETRAHQHVISRIRRSVRMGLGSSRVRVRLSERDRALLGADLERLDLTPEQAARVEIVTCDRLGPGDLEVDWDQGGLSYSFAEICEEILRLLRNSKPAPGPSGREPVQHRQKGGKP